MAKMNLYAVNVYQFPNFDVLLCIKYVWLLNLTSKTLYYLFKIHPFRFLEKKDRYESNMKLNIQSVLLLWLPVKGILCVVYFIWLINISLSSATSSSKLHSNFRWMNATAGDVKIGFLFIEVGGTWLWLNCND